MASYLVEDSVGSFDLSERTAGGIRFYQAQASSLSAARKAKNRKIMDMQPGITQFESMFSGPFPFKSDGVAIGRPSASFEEEMQTMITFAGGTIDTDTLYHENMHQWWGDHVTEHGYQMTFYKEGLATLAEFLYAARRAQAKAGGPGTKAGRRAFQRSLVHTFNTTYASKDGFWTVAPSNPTPWALFGTPNTYLRPGISYIALRQILGHAQLHPGAGADPAAVRRWLDRRAATGSGVRALAAQPQRGLHAAAQPVLPAMVGHRLPEGRRGEPATDHRARPRRPRLLYRRVHPR